MGAKNFHKVNADKYYVIHSPVPEDEEEEPQERQQLDASDVEDMLLYAVECNPHKVVEHSHLLKPPKSQSELRNYSSFYLGTFSYTLWFNNKNEYIGIILHAFLRAGYHEAANLDWEKQYSISGMDELDDLQHSDFMRAFDGIRTPKQIDAIYNRTMPRVEAAEKDTIAYVHSIFSHISEPYIETARLSDGTAIYHGVDTNRQQQDTTVKDGSIVNQT